MIPTAPVRAELKRFGNKSFIPLTRDQAVAQYLTVALEKRAFTQQAGSVRFGLIWQTAKWAVRKAKEVRDAQDWRKAVYE